jgi:hypothetical protein
MWARVKGETENALLRLPFKAVYLFRPGVIVPLNGIRSRTRLYRMVYSLTGPVLLLLQKLIPGYITTTEKIGQAMIRAARQGAPVTILENADINRLCLLSPRNS